MLNWHPAHLSEERDLWQFPSENGFFKNKMRSTCFWGGSRPGRDTDPLGIVNHHHQHGSLKNSVVALWREWSTQWVRETNHILEITYHRGEKTTMVSIGKDRKRKIQQEGIEETKSYKNTTDKE